MTPDHFQKLAAAGLSVEQIGVVMQIMAEAETAMKAADEARKSVARERVQRWRDKQKADVTLPKHNGNATVRLTRAEDSSSTSKITGKEKEPSPAARSKGTRIPDDFVPDIKAAIAEGLSRSDAEREARTFIDYWRARPGKEALKMDWPATWRVWFRKRLEQPRSTAPPQRQPAETVGSLSRKQLLTPKAEIDVTDYSTERVGTSGSGRLPSSAGDAGPFTVSGNLLGSF